MNTKTAVTTTAHILVVDDHAAARESTADILRHAGRTVHCCSSAIEALRVLERRSFDVILTDLKMPGMTGLEFICALQQRNIDTQIIMMTAYASVASAVEAMRYGAFDYIEKPFSADQLDEIVERAIRHGRVIGQRSTVPTGDESGHALIGHSSAMQLLRQRIAQAAPTDETVLITGESGVGKELVARAIHAASRRTKRALVSLNCPALSPQLLESELFGHERGAFTSADAPRIGRFELADHGTIFLDEVTEISLPLQAKLLRVLQEREFERVGSNETRRTDVRVVAATNRNLRQEVQNNRFREDLYFRLAVIPIDVPPLRDRRDDIEGLANHFLGQAACRLNKTPCQLEPSALELLEAYNWPGNIRELENIMTRASVLSSGNSIASEQLDSWLIGHASGSTVAGTSSESTCVGMSLREMERKLIEATLEQFDGHRVQTAQALGIGVRTLTNKMREYGYAPRTKVFVRAA